MLFDLQTVVWRRGVAPRQGNSPRKWQQAADPVSAHDGPAAAQFTAPDWYSYTDVDNARLSSVVSPDIAGVAGITSPGQPAPNNARSATVAGLQSSSPRTLDTSSRAETITL